MFELNNNVSNYSLSFKPEFCLSFLCSSRFPPGSLPPPALHPIPAAPSTKARCWLRQTHKQFDGGELGKHGRLGEQALCISRIGGAELARGHRPRDDFAWRSQLLLSFSDTEFNIPTPADPPTQDTLMKQLYETELTAAGSF